MKQITVTIDKDLHYALKVKAMNEGKTQKLVIKELITNYVKK